MFVFVYVAYPCMYIFEYVCCGMWVYQHMFCVCEYMCVWTCVCMSVWFVNVCFCVSVYMFVCVCLCVWLYVYIMCLSLVHGFVQLLFPFYVYIFSVPSGHWTRVTNQPATSFTYWAVLPTVCWLLNHSLSMSIPFALQSLTITVLLLRTHCFHSVLEKCALHVAEETLLWVTWILTCIHLSC